MILGTVTSSLKVLLFFIYAVYLFILREAERTSRGGQRERERDNLKLTLFKLTLRYEHGA